MNKEKADRLSALFKFMQLTYTEIALTGFRRFLMI